MLTLKKAIPADAEPLEQLSRRTFIETFEASNAKEDMDAYLDLTFSPEKQLSEILDPSRRIEIAWIGEDAVGFFHLKVGEVESCVKGDQPIEVLRIYVDRAHHGQGVAKALMDRALELAKSEGFRTVWLGVWEENFRAQAFYRKYKFEVVGNHEFKLGNDGQNDLIMCLTLS